MVFLIFVALLSAFLLRKNIKQKNKVGKILSGLFLVLSLLSILLNIILNDSEKKKDAALIDYYSLYQSEMENRDTSILNLSDIDNVVIDKKNEKIKVIYSDNIKTFSDVDKKLKFKTVLGHFMTSFNSWKKTSDYHFKDNYYPSLSFYDKEGNVIATTDTLSGDIYLQK